MSRHRVVIIGGGFGGLCAARAFAGVDIALKLIDKRNFHLFQPLLYQVATGVQASPLAQKLAEKTGVQTDRQGRLMVKPDLSIEGHPEIFFIGDMAHVPGKDGRPLPGLAPAATQQGRYVARLIRKRLTGGHEARPFAYFDKGTLSVIGRHQAVADIGRWHLSGFLAWLLWLFVHLILLINFENRLIVLTRWAFQYFFFSRGGRQLSHEGTLKLPISTSGVNDGLKTNHRC